MWGDYGRMEKKSFMGVVQIVLDDLDLSNIVIGWYKLFQENSIVNLPAGAKGAGSGGLGSGPASLAGSGSLMSASMESFS